MVVHSELILEAEHLILVFLDDELFSHEFMYANVSFDLEFRKETLILLIDVLDDFAEVIQKGLFTRRVVNQLCECIEFLQEFLESYHRMVDFIVLKWFLF